MAYYTTYATKTDLESYLGVVEAALPEGYARLLQRASELVRQVTMGNILATNADHLEAAKLATCAQVEYWDKTGELTGEAQSFSLGDLSMNMGSSNKSANALCARAKGYLNEQCLLCRAIKWGNRDEVQQV